MKYEEKFKIGDIVKGVRTFNGEVIEGKFNGFCLYNKLNPNSVVGVIMTNDGCYDVSVDSIESLESEDERISKAIIAWLKSSRYVPNDQVETLDSWVAWLEKQGEQKPIEQDTEIRDLWVYIREWNDKFGRLPKDEDELASCIDYVIKRQKPAEWSEEDEKMRKLLINILNVNHPNGFFKVNEIDDNMMRGIHKDAIVDWLESIKPNNWKPSKDQMFALRMHIQDNPNLESLYNDLKKL